MLYEIDYSSGTGQNSCRVPFSGKKTALVIATLVDADKQIVEGAVTAAQAFVRMTMQQAGYDVIDGNTTWFLEADPNAKSYVDIELHVGKEAEETTAKQTVE